MRRVALWAAAVGLAAGLTACSSVDKTAGNPASGGTVQTKYLSAKPPAEADKQSAVVPAGFRATGSVFESGKDCKL